MTSLVMRNLSGLVVSRLIGLDRRSFGKGLKRKFKAKKSQMKNRRRKMMSREKTKK